MIDGKQIKNTTVQETKLNMQGNLVMNNNRITGVKLPQNNSDAANKRYVDAIAQGLIIKNACILATNTSADLTGFNYSSVTDKWTNVITPTFDSVALTDLDRILIKNDTVNANVGNGIWIYHASASEFIRAEDSDNSGSPNFSELRGGSFTFVTSGTANANTGWVISSPNREINLSTDPVVWTQFSGAGAILPGAGIDKTGSTISVKTDNVSIEIFADQVRIKSGGITGDKFNTAVAGTGLNLNGISNALDVVVDNITLEIISNALQVKEDGIGLTEIDSLIFGNGLIIAGSPNLLSINIGNAFEFAGTVLNAKLNSNASIAVTVDGLNASTITELYGNPLGSGIGSPTTDFNTGITLSETPAGNSKVLIYLNGVKDDISYGTKTSSFWFEPAGGGSARVAADLIATDELHFNPTLAEFELEIDDSIELVYNKIQ